jgi:hypothetical protein
MSDSGGGGGGGLGGAIFNHRGLLTLTNCTVEANVAQGGDSHAIENFGMYGTPGGSGYGGGVFNLNGTVVFDGCTLSSNISNAGYFYAWVGENSYVWVSTYDTVGVTEADGGAFYNLAFGNKIEDGSASSATVTMVNTVLTNSSMGPSVIPLYTNGSYLLLTNTFPLNDLVNSEVDGNQTNTATVIFSTNSPALIHIDLAAARSITAATGSQAALLSAAAFSANPEFQFNVVGVPGYNYVVQVSTNLSDWVSLGTNTAPFLFVDQGSSGCPTRFYRAVYQP